MAAVVGAMFVSALIASSSALAITQRGHVFSFAFGKSGKGVGQFSHPSGVAVNDESGEVYVADKKNGAVEEFKPISKEGELTEEEFTAEFAVPSPTAVAVDNSAEPSDPSKGDVYVVGSGGKTIFKLGPSGEAITKITDFKVGSSKSKEKLSGIEGLAVNSQGELLLDSEADELLTYSDAIVNQGQSEAPTGLGASQARGFAVDSEGDAYIATNATSEEALKRAKEEEREETAMYAVAKVDPSSATVLIPELDTEDTTGVGVDESTNEAFVANLRFGPGGKLTSTVAAFGADGSLIQRLSAPGLSEGTAVAVDPEGHVVYVADGASARVYVFELEPSGRPTVEGLRTQGLQPGGDVSNATKLEAQLDPEGAETHYHFEYGSASCASEPAACTSTPSTSLPAGFGDQPVTWEIQSLPAGTYYYRLVAENSFGEVVSAEQTFTIAAIVSGLADGREWELVSPPEKAGAEPEAPTKEGGTIQASESGAAISYVADGPMPAGSEPEGVRSPEFTQVLSARGAQGGWSSQNITTLNTSGFGILVGVSPEYQTFSSSLALGLVKPNFGSENSGSLERPPLAPEAKERTIYLRDDAPLAPGESEEADYRAAVAEGEKMEPHNAGYLPLVTAINAPGGKPFGGGDGEGIVFEAATPDLSHVVLATSKGEPGIYEWSTGVSELQRVSVLPASEGGAFLSPASARVGAEGKNVRHAISNDGSRVFWSAGGHLYVSDPQTGETLRVDANAGGSGNGQEEAAFQIASADGSKVFFTDNQALTPLSRPGGEGDPDLYVYELNPGTPLSGTLRDLTPEGLEGASANVLATRTGGGVIGASEDGSYVYFVANGVLAPGAKRGTCPREAAVEPRGVTCNLYIRHFNGKQWEPTKLIAAISSEDYPDWEGAGTDDLDGMTAGASPEGDYLAFMSDLPLTGYDNEDVSSEAPGERLDEEVFLYDAESGHLVCASCDPTGARPHGVFDFGAHGEGAGEGLGLVVDRPQTWAEGDPADHWLAGSLPGWTSESAARAIYQPRYLSDSGRLFFDSADAIVPLAKPTKTELVNGTPQQVGVENVYEYERPGLGGCKTGGGCVSLISSGTSEHESAFLDASISGDDVFFLTAARLAAQDHDGLFDVYDAHVCEADSPCAPPPPPAPAPPCEGEACQGAYTPPAAFQTPPTSTFSGSGNLVEKIQVLSSQESKSASKPKPLTRAQKLAKALKTCRAKYKKQKSRRAACEKQARRKYGPKPKSKTSGKGK
jgi:DNA-binding beta-propeller fold protein YncE